MPVLFCKKYISAYQTKNERMAARNRRVEMLFSRTCGIFQDPQDCIEWIADKVFLSPKTVGDILAGRDSNTLKNA